MILGPLQSHAQTAPLRLLGLATRVAFDLNATNKSSACLFPAGPKGYDHTQSVQSNAVNLRLGKYKR